MGQYIDNVDNLVEGLLEVIPLSFFSSSAFDKQIQNSQYRLQWCLFVGLTVKESLGGKDAVTEVKIRRMCRSLTQAGAPSIYKFVSFLINSYCSHNNTKINLKEIKESLHSMGVAKFDKIKMWDSSDDVINIENNKAEKAAMPKTLSEQSNIMDNNKNVFIVHGHNKELRTEVKNVLHELKLKPIVLSEQPNKRKTIIDKFEEQSKNANYAIILLTADDKGKPKNSSKRYKLRARQNVIFEMGYFMARLESNIFLLIEDENMELPSDIQGIAYSYIKHDWKHKLAQELRACGYNVTSDDISVE